MPEYEASAAAKAFILGLLSAAIIDSEELVFTSAFPANGTIDITCDSIPFASFRLTIQEITA